MMMRLPTILSNKALVGLRGKKVGGNLGIAKNIGVKYSLCTMFTSDQSALLSAPVILLFPQLFAAVAALPLNGVVGRQVPLER